MERLVHPIDVEVIGSYRLRLTFENGIVGGGDFSDETWDGVFEPLRDPEYFALVRVGPEVRTIAWPNGADMAPEPLYEKARRNQVKAGR